NVRTDGVGIDTASPPNGFTCTSPATDRYECDATLTIAAGDTTQAIDIPLVDDSDEGDKTTSLFVLTGTGYTTVNPGFVRVTITDDDAAPMPTLSISANKTEVTEGPDMTVVFTVTSTGPPAADLNVFVRQSGEGSWLVPGDLGDRDISIPMGEAMGHFTATIDDDDNDEANGTIVLTMDPVPGYELNLNATSVTVNVMDNDDAPAAAYTIADVSAEEGDAMAFEIVRSAVVADTAVSLTWAVEVDADATNAADTADFDGNFPTGTAMIEVGESTATLTVTANDDDTDEMDETFDFTASEGGTEVATATGTIENDDPASALDTAPAEEIEGTNLVFTVSLNPISDKPVTVDYKTSNGTATAEEPSDYTAIMGTLSFNPGEIFKFITVTTIDDDVYEATEDMFMVFSNGVNVTIGTSASTARGMIRDSETGVGPGVTIAAGATAAEGSTLEFEVKLDGVSEQIITVGYITADGTAKAAPATNVDYTTTNGNLVFGAGVTTLTVSVATTDDKIYEPDETLTLALILTGGQPVTSGMNTMVTATITDNDNIGLSIASVSGRASVAEADGNVLEFAVSLGEPASVQDSLTVGYTLDGTAETGGSAEGRNDYTTPSDSLVFGSSDGNSKTITVAVRDDTEPEDAETVVLTLDTPTATRVTLIPGMTSATGTIELNDQPPAAITVSIAAGASPVTEGTAAEFIVTASSAPSGSDLPVSLDISGADSFTGALPSMVTIADGMTTGTVSIATLPDTLYETHGTLIARVQNIAGYDPDVNNDTASVSVQDDDDIMLTIAVSGSASVAEADGNTLEFEVDLGTPTGVESDLEVAYALSGDATAGSDYTNPGTILTFSSGDGGSKVITLTVIDDDETEDAETVVLTLDTPTAQRVTLGAASTATGIIQESDQPLSAPVIMVPTTSDYVNIGNEDSFTVSGTAMAGASVSLAVSDSGDGSDATDDVTGTTTADSDDDWSFTGLDLSGLEDSAITITVTASQVDRAESKATVTLT
ncbi:MAG: Calx-beta domain-containing protein, partial [Pseudohongiellaceae bacterium]